MVAEASAYDRRVTGDQGKLELADGRRLEWCASPGSSSKAVLVHLGTPSAAVPYAPMVQCVVDRGCRFVTYSRPGYADSTRRAGRSVADCVADVVELARALGIEQLHVVGWSGGGPHALACAALVPELVVSAATLAGVAPWGAEGLDWLDGMAEENHEEFGAALAGHEELARFLEPLAADVGSVTAETVTAMLGGLVTAVDKQALTGDFAEWSALTLRRAVSSGIWGWHDDDLAFARHWGFALGEITVPVTVWQGRQDAMVPYAHGGWLASHLPRARAMLFEDEGHLSLLARFDDVVADLLASS
jgi:pimeloyl-ACP methyl ester carboxylesterase